MDCYIVFAQLVRLTLTIPEATGTNGEKNYGCCVTIHRNTF